MLASLFGYNIQNAFFKDTGGEVIWIYFPEIRQKYGTENLRQSFEPNFWNIVSWKCPLSIK